MDDVIQVHWHQEFGSLHLDCDADSFARITQFIREQVPDFSEIDWKEVNTIGVRLVQEREPQIEKSWGDRITLLGCGVVGFFLLAIFLAGLAEVFSWFGF